MSDKAIFHRDGIMVIQNKETGQLEPADPIVKNLECKIEELEEQINTEKDKESVERNKHLIKENKNKIMEIESEIKYIRSCEEKLIDLNNQIILCLDTPQDSLFDALMSLMSQDTAKDQKYSYVEKSGSGKLGTKNNILRGMPVLFSTRVIDDTQGARFEEKNRRFIHVTPDTSEKKIQEAKRLIGHKFGSLEEEYDEVVVSRDDKEKAKQIIRILTAKLKQHSKHFEPKQSGVKIPFEAAIVDSIPNNQVWNMTVTERMMKYLSIITKANMDSRPKLVNEDNGKFYPISTFDDLKETLKLMEIGASGIRPYIADWFNNGFTIAYKELDGYPNVDKDENGNVLAQEKRPGLTTEQLAEKTKQFFNVSKPSSQAILYKFLYPLINQGIINKVKSEIDGRQNIYYPVDEEGNLFSMFDDNKDLRLKVSDPGIFPSKNFLKKQFRILSKYYIEEGGSIFKKKSCYKLVDIDGGEISVDHLIDKYLNNPETCFVEKYDYSHTTAITKNLLMYSLQVIQKQKENNFNYL